jgi:hypothetical protein
LGKHYGRLCISEHGSEAIFRKQWVKRKIGPTGLENAQDADHHRQ